ncbi:hypothetical protein BJF86_12385 [Serinicoccus sp. CNJ-927]|uniref:epoxide hydrolase family protein n=1 Tax=Serinicoccus sp. CNJ-927 TaxID=1904970 RepID=UPI0009671A37|nr:epoxide hydrolase family protein [Serinicoccus sp. CNJ-927]OLT44550.1 hypothetical protein BJF86_12385 [Serinicoccus sp. CNJ-927]
MTDTTHTTPRDAEGAAPTITQEVLDDLAQRLARTRWSTSPAPVRGMSTARLQELVRCWQGADWRSTEAWLADHGSALTTTADGRALHYLHVPGAGGAAGGLPIALLHGWPDSPLLYRRMLPLLVGAGHPVVVPSATGFGWSEEPAGELSADLVAEDVHGLMTSLGYDRYLVHGTDWGGSSGAALAAAHPEAVVGLHLLQPPVDRVFLVDPDTATEAERAFLADLEAWGEDVTYISMHGAHGDTLAAALADSPAGLLAWIGEKYDAWGGSRMQDEDIIDATAILWLTGSFRSSIRLYSETEANWHADAWEEPAGDGAGSAEQSAWSGSAGGEAWTPAKVEVPTAFALFGGDLMMPPRELCERCFAVERFTLYPEGGHWPALEEPEQVVRDVLAFADGRS